MNLYIVHVGYYDPEVGMYELHSNFFVVAEDPRAARQAVKEKAIFIAKKMHIDAIQEILNVDGYDIRLTKNDSAQKENRKLNYNDLSNLPEDAA